MGLYKTTVAYFLLNLVVQAITKTLSFTDCAYKWLSITCDVGSAKRKKRRKTLKERFKRHLRHMRHIHIILHKDRNEKDLKELKLSVT
jgi:hypothetical protein